MTTLMPRAAPNTDLIEMILTHEQLFGAVESFPATLGFLRVIHPLHLVSTQKSKLALDQLLSLLRVLDRREVHTGQCRF